MAVTPNPICRWCGQAVVDDGLGLCDQCIDYYRRNHRPRQPTPDTGSLGREQALRLVFGSSARYELAAWIIGRDSDHFHAADYSHETGNYSPAVMNGVDRLVALGMVRRVQSPNGRSPLYQRLDHALWSVYAAGAAVFGNAPELLGESLRKDLELLSARLRSNDGTP